VSCGHRRSIIPSSYLRSAYLHPRKFLPQYLGVISTTFRFTHIVFAPVYRLDRHQIVKKALLSVRIESSLHRLVYKLLSALPIPANLALRLVIPQANLPTRPLYSTVHNGLNPASVIGFAFTSPLGLYIGTTHLIS
jgi:hypothetical protein